MPIRRTPNKTPGERLGSNTPTSKQKEQPSLGNSARNTLNSVSASNNDNGASKYVMAVNMAKEKFKDDPDVNQTIFRNSVDEIYNDLKEEGDKSAADLRGENWLQQAGRAVGEGIDTVNNGIGYGLDWLLDNIAGNAIGLFDQQAGQNFKDMWDAEDLAIVPDIAEDIGLSLIPYAGIPLAMGKNAAQRTDEIAEAITGRDSVTQEKLNGYERGGRAVESALGVGLSAIPGVGKAAASKALPDMSERALTTLIKDGLKESGADVGDLAGKGLKAAQKEQKAAAKEARKAGKGKGKEAAAEETGEATAKEGAENATAEGAEPSRFRQALNSIRESRPGQLAERGARATGRLLDTPARNALSLTLPTAEWMAAATGAYGEDPLTSSSRLIMDAANNGDFFANPIGMAAMIGSRKLSDKMMPSVGRYRTTAKIANGGKERMRDHLKADAPYQAARATAAGNVFRDEVADDYVDNPEMDYNELIARLQAIGGQR